MCKQRERIHVASNHRKSPCCFSKEKAHGGRDVAGPVPPMSPGSICSQDAHLGCEAAGWEGKLQWVEQQSHRQKSESAEWNALLVFVYPPL